MLTVLVQRSTIILWFELQVLLETWEPLWSCDQSDSIDRLTSLLVTTAILERSLGDV